MTNGRSAVIVFRRNKHEQDRISSSSSRAGWYFQKDAEAAVKAFTDVVAEAMKAGDKVQLVGFGTFEVSERAAREGRNPRTVRP